MLTREQITESLERTQARPILFFFCPPPIDSYFADMSHEDAALIVSVIGDDFIKNKFDTWGDTEKVQMETLIDVCANWLDM